jgi:hypothetical protein
MNIQAQLFLTFACLVIASGATHAFDVRMYNIEGAHIGDSRHVMVSKMGNKFPTSTQAAIKSSQGSRVYTKPVSCEERDDGSTLCKAKFAKMKRSGQQKEFTIYRDLVAEFNRDQELAFLSVIDTTRHDSRKQCMQALSNFHRKLTTSGVGKPLVVYPRDQLDIYYMKIDEAPFTTRMMGRLESAFSMVWQHARNDWSAFYSVDFGCRNSGHMVVNRTLYDKGVKDGTKTVSGINANLSVGASD